jgi:hypothetical protein
MRTGVVLISVWWCVAWATAADRDIEFRSGQIGVRGVVLPEAPQSVLHLSVRGKLNDAGAGTGTLTLDHSPLPAYDEFGFATASKNVPPIVLECSFQFRKKTVREYTSRRLGAPPNEVTTHREEWHLYSVTGPKLTSKFNLAILTEREFAPARLLLQSAEGKVEQVIDLRQPPVPEPCHPGCFLAGTPVVVPGGTQPIQDLRAGMLVSVVKPDGTLGQAPIESVFVTQNRLVEITTEQHKLVTTTSQPLALVDGKLRSAGDLQPGDQIYHWSNQQRQAVAVRTVTLTTKTAEVFNLVLGDPQLMIAGGFVVRSKPSPVLP